MRAPIVSLQLLLAVVAVARAGSTKCPPDAVRVGPACVDTYEASVWSLPDGSASLVNKIQRGKVTLGELRGGGAVQVGSMTTEGCSAVDYGMSFPVTGNWTIPLYAVAIPGVLPSTCITWFQAEQACRLAGKRLVTNEEWQAAAAGTPDPGAADDGVATCATFSSFGALAGSRTACVSSWGAHDMVGNAWEWTAEWTPQASTCAQWDASFGEDIACYGGYLSSAPATTAELQGVPRDVDVPNPSIPAALIRGGNFGIEARSGVFATYAGAAVTTRSRSIGFRCAR